MAEARSRALLLRRIPYGDSSLICHLLSESHGRISLLARGARRVRSPFRATLEPLYMLHVRWRPGRTGMGYLQEAIRGSALLPQSRMLAGLELLAMAKGLYREQDPHGFAEVCTALRCLAEGRMPGAKWAAMWRLLELCGWVGGMEACWSCNREVAHTSAMFWRDGLLLCPACGRGRMVRPETRLRMRALLAGAAPDLPVEDGHLWREMIVSVLGKHHIRLPDLDQQNYHWA
ncbi:MAG: DNA repair protein RecO [Zetaproteobacteria bacterium]|nr:MAG: DNA repair protein RecO [Zetaproteobacteria bacterium]